MSAERAAERTASRAAKGFLLGIGVGGWGSLIVLGVIGSTHSEPAPAASAESQAPNQDGLAYIAATLGTAAVFSGIGKLSDLLAKDSSPTTPTELPVEPPQPTTQAEA